MKERQDQYNNGNSIQMERLSTCSINLALKMEEETEEIEIPKKRRGRSRGTEETGEPQTMTCKDSKIALH